MSIIFTVIALFATSANATPPDPVDDLIIETGSTTAVAMFTPTAGATWYEVRVWETSMTTQGWTGYYLLSYGGCTPNSPLCVTISDLDNCHDWYWATGVYGTGGWSDISNESHESTRCPPQYGEVECAGRKSRVSAE